MPPRRQVKAEVPRWRRGTQVQPAHQVILGRRQQVSFTREVAKAIAANPEAAKTGNIIPPHQAVPGSRIMAATGAYRFRMHLVPFAWLAAVTGGGLAFRLGHHPVTHAVTAALAAGVAMVLLSRPGNKDVKDRFIRLVTGYVLAVLTVVWLPLLAAFGTTRPLPVLLAGCWLAVTIPWVRHYRWRPQPPQAAPAHLGDAETWAKLAAKRRWSGHLDNYEQIPNGRRWRIVLDGSETDIGEVMSQPRKIAAAWGKAMTEAYAEPSRDGVESRGTLTLLRAGTLGTTREWDGSGISPADGTAVIGRYADGQDARIRFFARRDGVRHGLIAGCTGAGKSYLLDLIIRIALTSGYIVPVVLDPQEGQSLPYWRGRVPYASGVEECMAMLRGLQAGMLDRSRYLSTLHWDDDGYPATGMDFFDHELTGLPIVLAIGDEYPVLLTDRVYGDEARRLTADLGKRGRKTGTALWPVAQVPSLSELADQVIRSMLVGGNVVCLRTGDRVSAGMIGLDADPSLLPKYFPDGKPTYGLGYVVGPDMRQAVARADAVSVAARRRDPVVPVLDERFAAAMSRVMSRSGPQLAMPSQAPPAAGGQDDEPAAAMRCADAVVTVLDGELNKGDIISRVMDLSAAQGRDKPFSLRTIGVALEKLLEDGRITRPAYNTYSPVRTTLRVVTGNSHTETEVSR
jgi:hypothetical protein